MDYSLYEKVITKRLIYFSIIGCIVVILSICAIIYVVKNMRGQKVLFYILNILSVGALIGSIVLVSVVASSSIHDISKKAYIVWKGEFIVGEDVETRSGTCTLYLPDKHGLKLETDAYLLEPGKYTGQVVYGEKTKIVLDIQAK